MRNEEEKEEADQLHVLHLCCLLHMGTAASCFCTCHAPLKFYAGSEKSNVHDSLDFKLHDFTHNNNMPLLLEDIHLHLKKKKAIDWRPWMTSRKIKLHFMFCEWCYLFALAMSAMKGKQTNYEQTQTEFNVAFICKENH